MVRRLLYALALFLLSILPAAASSYGDINITSAVPGTGATNLGKAEDAAHTSGDTGVAVYGVRNDTAASFGATGDYSPMAVSAAGNVKVQVESTQKDTYVGSTAYFTPAASATDLVELYYGGSRVIKVHRVVLQYRSTTSANVNNFFLLKRSSANSSGTAVTTTIVPLDSSAGAVGAVMKHYTANPTTGSLVGNVGCRTTSGNVDAVSGTSGAPEIVLFDEHLAGGPIVLRSSGQGIVINNNGVTVSNTSPSLAATIYWTEE